MIDMTKPPTPRECNEVVRRAVREASRAAPGGSFRPAFVHDVASSREAARAQAAARCEQEVTRCNGQLAAAQDAASRTNVLLASGNDKGETPAAQGYQERYRAGLERNRLAAQADQSARSATAATAGAHSQLAVLKAELAWIDQCTMAWLQPWLEGVALVDPALVDSVQLFDLGGLVGQAGPDPLQAIAQQHPALFGTADAQPALGAASAQHPALDQASDEPFIPATAFDKETQHA